MLFSWIYSYQGFSRLQKLPAEAQRITFYSEGKYNWPHLEALVKELATSHNQAVCYVTSDFEDPGLAFTHPNVKAFYIGDGMLRTSWFRSSRVPLIVMTMPDLEHYYIKRSAYGGAYVYIHHSLVSSHMIYKEQAFDYFDAILCAGPHHMLETKEREALTGLAEKRLLQHGYGKLDYLLEKKSRTLGGEKYHTQPHVLIAPSWGDDCILERYGENLIEALLSGGVMTTLRPHPMTNKRSPQIIDMLNKRFDGHPFFSWDQDITGFNTYLENDIMISDWSGAALEFAFAFEKPVLFIDVPPKVRNPNYANYKNIPVEKTLRDRIGAIVSIDAFNSVPQIVETMHNEREHYIQKIRSAREDTVYNIRESAQTGAKALIEYLHECEAKSDLVRPT